MRPTRWISMTALAEIIHKEHGKFSIRASHFLLDEGTLSFKGNGIYFKHPIEGGVDVVIRLTYQRKAGGIRSVTASGVVIEGQKGAFTIQLDPIGSNDKAIQELAEHVDFIQKSGGSDHQDGLSILS